MIRIGIIGTGGMARVHAQEFNTIRGCKVTACADIDEAKAKTFAETHGIPAAYGDAEIMLAKEKLDGVTIVAPDSAHAPIALQALQHGLHVMCEKPLATNYPDARHMANEAQARHALTAVNFSYRNSPATQKAAALTASGALGRIIHVDGRYLQGWLTNIDLREGHASPGLLWRLSIRHGSAGVLGDLGVHLFDLADFIVGEFAEITCELKTFPKPVDQLGEYVFDANDSAIATVRFQNGAIGTLHTTRWAGGHGNTVGIRVYGTDGSLDLDLDRPADDQLRVCLGEKARRANQWQSVKCPKTPNMYQRFFTAIKTGQQGQTSFAGGARIQSYLDAAQEAAKRGGYISL